MINSQIENCLLCKAAGPLSIYQVAPLYHKGNEIRICEACTDELSKTDTPDSRYWRFLTEAMWSEIPAIQVLSWRILNKLSYENWASDCLDILYLDDETMDWAKAGNEAEPQDSMEVHRDSLDSELRTGDTVVLTRSLDVKGSSLNAKMGTVVKNIRLVADNTDQIEGKIDGQTIVILTKYLRKQKS